MVWNKGKKGLQPSTKKGKTFIEFYGSERTEKITRKISETRKKLIKEGKIQVKTDQLHTEEAKKKCYTKERNKKISDKLSGRKLSKKTKRKLSKTRKRKCKSGEIIVWNKGLKGVQRAWNKGKECKWVTEKNLKNNPMKNLKVRKAHSKHMIKFYEQYPEKHPNRILAKQKKVSTGQKILFNIVHEIFPDAELNYRIITKKKRTRHADVGIPSLLIDLEYNEYYKHFTSKGKREDKKRTKELNKIRWKVIVFEPKDLKNKENLILFLQNLKID